MKKRLMTKKSALLWMMILPTTAFAQDSLTVKEQRLDEVVINANTAKRRVTSTLIGAEQLQMKELVSTPSLFGETDIMRSIQLLPGVKAESDASSSFEVRGGTSAQNTILYDEAPIYNVGHLAGLFSAFNDNALAAGTLYKGLVPAQYGGATSAVFDITSRSGNYSDWHGGATIGLLSAKAAVEGPLVKDKLSILLNARRSYMDLFMKQVDDFKDNTLYFYDANVKVSYRASDRDRLNFSFFTSHDKTALEDMVDLQWSNLAASLSWTHLFRETAHSQTTFLYSDYHTDNGVDIMGLNISFAGHIRQGGLRQNFRLSGRRHELNTGFHTMLYDVLSAEWQKVTLHEEEKRQAWENSVWINETFRLSPLLTVSGGLRLSAFSNLGGPYYYDVNDDGNITWMYKTHRHRIVNTQTTLEPRLSVTILPTPSFSVKAGYSRTAQNIHALRNQSTSTPFDRYAISSNLLKPQVADQVSLGVFTMTPGETYDFSLEGYYRHINHVLDYRDGVSFSSEIEMERLVLPGEGKSYGAELCARKNSGRLTGWLAYTLSWTKTRIDGINNGQWYTAGNDRRHDVDIVALYRLSPAWSLNAVWIYNSGQAFTAPSGKYEMEDNYIYYYAERNGYRAPAYHRLDVSATWTRSIYRGRLTREWNFSVYNLYNRYNPYLIRFEDSNNGARTKATQFSLFGIVPSVSFTLKF